MPRMALIHDGLSNGYSRVKRSGVSVGMMAAGRSLRENCTPGLGIYAGCIANPTENGRIKVT